jgi:hypothetical protein
MVLELRRPKVSNKPEMPTSSKVPLRLPLLLQASRHRRPETQPLQSPAKQLNNRLAPRRTLPQHHRARLHNSRPVARQAATLVLKVRPPVRRELEAGLERRPRLTSKTVLADSRAESRGVMCWSRNR